MLIRLTSGPLLCWPGHEAPAAIGAGGIVPADTKTEGDGTTPAGLWRLRRVLYRADRVERPDTILPVRAIQPDDGWCDDPEDPAYNRPVRLPFGASCEELWRADHVYDLIVVLDHNDHPPVPGKGSAVFMHLARPGFPSTRGCVAITEDDLRMLLAAAGPKTRLEILLQ